MAYMMKVCELHERNTGGGDAYRYLVGWMNPETRLVIMPNREKQSPDDGEWVLYIAPLARPRADEDKDENAGANANAGA